MNVIRFSMALMLAFVIAIAMPFTNCNGQPATEIFKKIKAANSRKTICYDYKVLLVDAGTNSATDSIQGRFYKDRGNYLDSSNTAISARKDKFYCKFTFHDRSAMIYAIDDLEKKLGVAFEDDEEADIIPISDSALIRSGELEVTKVANGNFLVQMSFKDKTLSKVLFNIDPNTYVIKHIQFETVEKDRYNEKVICRKVYSLNNIRYTFNTNVLDLQRFFHVVQGKVVLNDKYTNYHLNTLTN